MNSTETASERYTTTLNPETGMWLRVDNEAGKSWSWKAKSKPAKPTYIPSNGVTLEKLQKAGNRVHVMHSRWAEYRTFGKGVDKLKGKSEQYVRPVIVPATFKRSGKYTFEAMGGYTNIHIVTVTGEDIFVTAECSLSDNFCYKAGVMHALSKLDVEEIRMAGL